MVMRKYRKLNRTQGIHNITLPTQQSSRQEQPLIPEQQLLNRLQSAGRISEDNSQKLLNTFPGFARFKVGEEGPVKRQQIEKDLLSFTVRTLSDSEKTPKFKGVQVQQNLTANGAPARGKISTPENTMYLNNASVNSYGRMDLAHTIVHEGNHAIEKEHPHIKQTVARFLEKKARNSEDQKIEATYIPKLFEGMQGIIRFPEREFKNLYKANAPNQIKESTVSDLKLGLRGRDQYFDELTTFALEAQMRNIPLQVGPSNDKDSRSLLKGVLRGMYKQYAALGFEEQFKKSSDLLKDRVVELRNRTKYPTPESYLAARGRKFIPDYQPLTEQVNTVAPTNENLKQLEKHFREKHVGNIWPNHTQDLYKRFAQRVRSSSGTTNRVETTGSFSVESPNRISHNSMLSTHGGAGNKTSAEEAILQEHPNHHSGE